jgi:hypothetical protein
MGEQITTTDLYESTFYLLGGCELVSIEAQRVDGSITCSLTFKGDQLDQLQLEYFAGKAKVPLFGFRRAFGQVNALVYSAKKRAKGQHKQAELNPGSAS